MYENLKILINTLGMKQSLFGESVGIDSSGMSEILKGNRGLSKTAITAICLKYSVNPEWLKSGIGPMFLPESQRSELSPEVFEIAKKLDSLPPEKKSLLTKMIKAGIE